LLLEETSFQLWKREVTEFHSDLLKTNLRFEIAKSTIPRNVKLFIMIIFYFDQKFKIITNYPVTISNKANFRVNKIRFIESIFLDWKTLRGMENIYYKSEQSIFKIWLILTSFMYGMYFETFTCNYMESSK
jgi:hypothetical protein